MPTLDHDNAVRLPAMPTSAVSLACCVGLALIGGMLGVNRGGTMNDGLLTLWATVPGVLIPAAILRAMPAQAPGAWSVPVLGGTMLRALIVLMVGLGLYALAGPSKVVYFLTLLAGLMITLVIDVTSLLMLVSKHAPTMVVAGESKGIC